MKKILHITSNLILAFMSLLMTGMFFIVCLYFYTAIRLPDVSTLQDFKLQTPMRIYTQDGQLISEFGHERRIPITFEQIPKHMIQAVLATEDKRFFEHPGVDIIGLMRATKKLLTTGRKEQGASTITMQVARNFFLTREKTFSRKINEILLALKIENQLSKKQILTLYLNKIFLGNRAYGIAAAAQVYYGKPLNALTLPQTAMIAGLPQAPSRDNPIVNPMGAMKRRNHVLLRMLNSQMINETEYRKAISAPITASYHGIPALVQAPYVAEMVRQLLLQQKGSDAYKTGLQIYTTLNARLQRKANQAIIQGLERYTQRHGYWGAEMNLVASLGHNLAAWQAKLKTLPTIQNLQPAAVTTVNEQSINALLANGKMVHIDWSGLKWARPRIKNSHYLGPMPQVAADIVKAGDVVRVVQSNSTWVMSQVPRAQATLIAMRPQDGAILALTGGFSYNQSHFNRAVQAHRQTGSAFKPFIYAAALNKGYTLSTVVSDAPIVLADSGENSLWRPQNHLLMFHGPSRLRVGLAQSNNLLSVRLLRNIGTRYTLNYIKRFGFQPDQQPHTLSLALGAGTCTPLELNQAYAILANGGYGIKPYLINRIEDAHGKLLYQAYPLIASTPSLSKASLSKTLETAPQVVDSRIDYLMISALQSVIQEGTGRRAQTLDREDIAGKTGSTNGLMDAWFAGFNPNIVTTVWVGFDKLDSLQEYGSKAALPIWIDFMRAALNGEPDIGFQIPPGLVKVKIDPKSGLLAQPDQPNAISEIFRQEYVPKQMASQTLSESAATEHLFQAD